MEVSSALSVEYHVLLIKCILLPHIMVWSSGAESPRMSRIWKFLICASTPICCYLRENQLKETRLAFILTGLNGVESCSGHIWKLLIWDAPPVSTGAEVGNAYHFRDQDPQAYKSRCVHIIIDHHDKTIKASYSPDLCPSLNKIFRHPVCPDIPP